MKAAALAELAAAPGSALELRPLEAARPGDLQAAIELLRAALPLDCVEVVAAEKLFASNGKRQGYTVGAFTPGGGELIGVLAQAGRWIKMLAVHPQARRQGVGSTLLKAARVNLDFESAGESSPAPRKRLRIADHPGNYLSPGIDVRYDDGHAFLRARGFVEVERNQNLRTPLENNPLLSDAHLAAQLDKVRKNGYVARRATAADVPTLSALISSSFAPVWAHEVERALGAELGGSAAADTSPLPEGPAVHVAFTETGVPVAFAAHDGNNHGLGWFGPMGTLPMHRGRGLGEALLLLCLHDVVREKRCEGGIIAWVGPVEFYARACGAMPERRFVVYEES